MAGDPVYIDQVVRIVVEGTLAVSGTTTSAARWIEGRSTVTVTDGRLTIGNGTGANVNEICFVEVTPQ